MPRRLERLRADLVTGCPGGSWHYAGAGWRRLAKLGGMAAGLATDAAGAGARLATAKASEAVTRLHERAARRMADQLGETKGLPLKVGQLLSYVDDAIPSCTGRSSASSRPTPCTRRGRRCAPS